MPIFIKEVIIHDNTHLIFMLLILLLYSHCPTYMGLTKTQRDSLSDLKHLSEYIYGLLHKPLHIHSYTNTYRERGGIHQLHLDQIQLTLWFLGQRHRARARGQPEHNKHTHTYTQKPTHTHRPVVHIKWINGSPEPSLDIITEASGQHCFFLLMSLYVSSLFVSCLPRATYTR